MKSKSILIGCAIALLALSFIAVYWFLKPPRPSFRRVDFVQLPGWEVADLSKSLATFQTSCRAFIKQDPERIVGTDQIGLQAKDWHPACHAALKINAYEPQTAKQFFEQWFAPVEFFENKPVKGLFTGYYLPLIKGSLTQSEQYNVPLYELPTELVTVDMGQFLPDLKNTRLVGRLEGRRLVPFYTRAQINKGAIRDTARVLLWLNSPIDRLFLEIQGSGIVALENGERVYIGYNGQNGRPYTPIGSVLIKKGVMTKENSSMQFIKHYLEAHPKQVDSVINQNKSFIFFRVLPMKAALGSQGVALTPGYSMAIDRQWVPMGAPLWLSTTRPDSQNPKYHKPMQRLMIAQDTGGAIRGKVRGDVFWGGGDKATLIAGHMKNEGHYWLLLPRHTLARLENK